MMRSRGPSATILPPSITITRVIIDSIEVRCVTSTTVLFCAKAPIRVVICASVEQQRLPVSSHPTSGRLVSGGSGTEVQQVLPKEGVARMRKVVVLAVMAVMVLSAVAFAAPAGAVGGTVCAKETGSATVTPGFSVKPHDQTFVVNESLSGCVGGRVKTGKARATLKYAAQTCLGLAKTGLKTAFAERWEDYWE